MMGGSGRVTVAPIDRGNQCGSNGTYLKVAVAVLADIRTVKKYQKSICERL
jgi:hypothetical protein